MHRGFEKGHLPFFYLLRQKVLLTYWKYTQPWKWTAFQMFRYSLHARIEKRGRAGELQICRTGLNNSIGHHIGLRLFFWNGTFSCERPKKSCFACLLGLIITNVDVALLVAHPEETRRYGRIICPGFWVGMGKTWDHISHMYKHASNMHTCLRKELRAA